MIIHFYAISVNRECVVAVVMACSLDILFDLIWCLAEEKTLTLLEA